MYDMLRHSKASLDADLDILDADGAGFLCRSLLLKLFVRTFLSGFGGKSAINCQKIHVSGPQFYTKRAQSGFYLALSE